MKRANEWQKSTGYNATEEECVGLLIALHFAWVGESIMQAFYSALVDANCHSYAAVVRGWLEAEPVIDTIVVDG